LPEPEAPTTDATADGDAVTRAVEIQTPDVKPISERLPGDAKPATGDGTTTATTIPRKPLKVPAGISVRVTEENLHEYVGP
jgi:Lon-like ATP-dependent protease